MTTTTTTAKTRAPLPQPQQIVTYPIGAKPDPTNDRGGILYLYYRESLENSSPSNDYKNLIFMCPGYPDDHECFMNLAHRLSRTVPDALVGVTCLPGYNARDPSDSNNNRYNSIGYDPNGYTFQEWTDAFRNAVACLKQRAPNAERLTGIFHDWGVVPGMMWTNQTVENNERNAPDQIVLFDVLGGIHPDDRRKAPANVPKDTVRDIVTSLSYRVVLATAFACRRYIHPALGRCVFGMGFSVLKLVGLTPTGPLDDQVMANRHTPLELDQMVYMAYPYYNLFKAMFGGKRRLERDFRGFYLPRDLQRTPVLYLYGTEKNVMFHDKTALAMLQQQQEDEQKGKDSTTRSKCQVVSVPNAGHWLYLQQPDVCYDYVANFVRDA